MAEADPRIEIRADFEQPASQAEPTASKSWLRPALMYGVPLLVLAGAGTLWATSGGSVSTDNAYVQQDKVGVASDVAGRIIEVAVRENQPVKAGDILFRIDPEPFRIALAQADAAIASAQVEVTTLKAGYEATGADIVAARDRINNARQDYVRQKSLMDRGFTTRARFEQAEHALEQANAALQKAEADAEEARAKMSTGSAVPGVNPAIATAQAQRSKALLDLERTTRRAPVDGIVTQASRLQIGQMMMSGMAAVTLVQSDRTWIEANFKETDLNEMRVGQKAQIQFDAYPGLKLKGHVASIGAQTGSESAILPAQNANGNWVKVTQRVPVRIEFDEKSPRQMIAGLSAKVTVDTRN